MSLLCVGFANSTHQVTASGHATCCSKCTGNKFLTLATSYKRVCALCGAPQAQKIKPSFKTTLPLRTVNSYALPVHAHDSARNASAVALTFHPQQIPVVKLVQRKCIRIPWEKRTIEKDDRPRHACRLCVVDFGICLPRFIGMR